MLTCFLPPIPVPVPVPGNCLHNSTRIREHSHCLCPVPLSLSLPFVFSSVISGPRVAKFWKFFVAQNWTAQEGLLLLLLLRLLPCGSRNSCEIKLNATPIIPRNLSFSHSWSRASGVRRVLSTPPPKLRNHQKFKRNTQFPRSVSPPPPPPCCFYKMIICTRNLTHSVSGHKSLNPSLTVWLSLCLLSLAPPALPPLFACQNQCRVLLSASAINKIHLDYKVHTKKSRADKACLTFGLLQFIKNLFEKRTENKIRHLYYILSVCVCNVANLNLNVANRKLDDFYVAHFDESCRQF